MCGEDGWCTTGELRVYIDSNAHNESASLAQSGEWHRVECTLGVDGITCRDSSGQTQQIRFGPGDVPLAPLPDSARKSKHSKLFPLQVADREGRLVLLAAETGAEMWRWCIAIRRRFRGPLEEGGLEARRLKQALCVATNMHGTMTAADVAAVVPLLVQGAEIDIESMDDYAFLDSAGANYGSKLMERKYTALTHACAGGHQETSVLALHWFPRH